MFPHIRHSPTPGASDIDDARTWTNFLPSLALFVLTHEKPAMLLRGTLWWRTEFDAFDCFNKGDLAAPGAARGCQ